MTLKKTNNEAELIRMMPNNQQGIEQFKKDWDAMWAMTAPVDTFKTSAAVTSPTSHKNIFTKSFKKLKLGKK